MEWKTIDAAPQDGTLVLVCGNNFGDPNRGRYVSVASYQDGYFYEEDADVYLDYLTHWHPLPTFPKLGAD